MSFSFNRRRQLAEMASRPKRALGQRIGLRPEKRDQYINDMGRYQGDLENNRVIDEMQRRANARGQSLDAPDKNVSAEQNNGRMNDLDYGLLQGQVMAERAAKKYLPLAGLGGIAAAGAGYAMNGSQPFTQVGTDPLAAARNSVAQANALLGSERMLEALTADQVESMNNMQSNQPQNFESYSPVIESLIDQKAQELMTYTVETAGGERGFSPELAYSNARDIVEKDLRAQGIL